MRTALENQRENQVPPQRLVDILSLVEIRRDGDAAGGYRLRADDEDLQDCTWYVVPEAGGFRLLAPGPRGANLGSAALARLAAGDAAGARRWLAWAAEDLSHGPENADPPPLVRLLNDSSTHDDALRTAAAALAAEGRHAAEAIPPPAAARQKTAESLGLEALRRGDFPTAEKLLRPLADRQKGPPHLLRGLAWGAVACGSTGPAALDDAQAAVARTAYADAACLTTLAAVYAEQGKTAEAVENLRRAVEFNADQPQDADHYVLGRVAEQLGLDDVAVELYRKVPCPKRPAADGAYALAQQRLKILGR